MRSVTAIAFALLASTGVALAALALLWFLNGEKDPPPARAASEQALYPQRNWATGGTRKLNLSVYAFSDRNRNGRYDTSDKPLAGIAVRLTRPDGSARVERSNINGYANFSMQRDGVDADISKVGETYRFELLPPEGWTVTTGNALQETAFRAIDAGFTGLAAVQPPAVVGLAPPSTISGYIPVFDPTQDAPVTLRISTGGSSAVSQGEAGAFFQLEAAAGTWTIEFEAGDRVIGRRIEQSYAPTLLGKQAVAVRTGASFAVNFDDTDRSVLEKLAPGYHGLDWDYLLAVDNQFYKGPGYVNGLMSGAHVAYNSSGHPVTIKAMEPDGRFDFVGAYFSVAWPSAEGETLIASAWRDGELVAEDRITLSHLSPVYFQADYQDISRLELSTEHYWQFVVDDMHFRWPDATGGNNGER